VLWKKLDPEKKKLIKESFCQILVKTQDLNLQEHKEEKQIKIELKPTVVIREEKREKEKYDYERLLNEIKILRHEKKLLEVQNKELQEKSKKCSSIKEENKRLKETISSVYKECRITLNLIKDDTVPLENRLDAAISKLEFIINAIDKLNIHLWL